MPVTLIFISVVLLIATAFVLGQKRGKGPRSLAETKTSRAVGGPTEAEPAKRINWLVGVGGEVKGRAFLVGHRTVTIGRAPTNFIQVVDEEASRTHTQVQPRDGYLQIIDMNSRNGTHVDGSPVAQGRLEDGGELRIGDARFVYRRQGAFGADAGLEGKAADSKKFTSTVVASGQDLVAVVQKAMRESEGDFESAANQLGVKPDVLRHLVVQKDIRYS